MDVNVTSLQERAKVEAKSYLEQLLSEGARKLLQAAIENEVAVYLQSQSGRRSESGERSVVRNGHLPERDLVTGVFGGVTTKPWRLSGMIKRLANLIQVSQRSGRSIC
jgi:hypothetical protein